MKKAMVNVPFDEEKLAAARLYMEPVSYTHLTLPTIRLV